MESMKKSQLKEVLSDPAGEGSQPTTHLGGVLGGTARAFGMRPAGQGKERSPRGAREEALGGEDLSAEQFNL